MQIFNYPTTIYFGQDAIEGLRDYLDKNGFKEMLVVTDPGLAATGIVTSVERRLWSQGLALKVFEGVRPNPTEKDVLGGNQGV